MYGKFRKEKHRKQNVKSIKNRVDCEGKEVYTGRNGQSEGEGKEAYTERKGQGEGEGIGKFVGNYVS